MLDTLLSAGKYPLDFAICVFLAAIPTIAWIFIFGRRHKHKKAHLLLTFIAGILSGILIMWYQNYWGQSVDAVFFSFEPQNFEKSIRSSIQNGLLASFLVFVSVGFLEEFLKHWTVKKADHAIFESIDDVIEFSIIGAVGFAFIENIGYFYSLILNGNGKDLISLFVVRSVFVVFIHILCSGIYGYFYGLGFFATPVLRDLEKDGKHKWIPDILHRILHMKASTVFRDEMATLGLIIAMTLHGLYDFLLHIALVIEIGTLTIPVHFIMLPTILIGGFWYLDFLLEKKEDQKRFGHIEDAYILSPV